MRNSIFKNFVKKVLKSEAFVSIAVVFVLALGIIGTSYALYMDVDTDTDYQVVQVGDLYVGFSNDGDNTVMLENMLPMEDEYALDLDKENGVPSIYSFYIYNSGAYTAKYSIKLVTGDGNEVDTKYINYVVCRDNATNCSDIKTFENLNESLVTIDELAKKRPSDNTNPSVYYFIKIWINNKYVPTKLDGEKVVLKVNVESTNASGYLDNKNTLAGALLNDENISINNFKPNFETNEVEKDGIYRSEDDFGISYYFRGNVKNNYVSFANKCWRVVRILGDGTIKLVLASNVGTCDTLTDNSAFIGVSEFNKDGNYNYDISGVKHLLDNWSTETFDENNINLINKDASWCLTNLVDAYNESDIIGTVKDSKSNKNEFNYSSYIRLNVKKNPTFKCEDNYVSMVGLMNADEVYFAGNDSYLKENSKSYWWTSTLAKYDSNNKDNIYWVDDKGKLSYGSPIFVNHDKGLVNVRPSIILKEDTMINKGVGTINEPYEVK